MVDRADLVGVASLTGYVRPLSDQRVRRRLPHLLPRFKPSALPVLARKPAAAVYH